jgi:antitoxin component YwqK of YwqJK toxin-antitoxin module
MEKHTNVPAAAVWNADNNEWELGEKNAAGKKTGIWNLWHEKGHLCNIIDYGDGNPPFLFKRFHPDGTLAQEGNWYGGDMFLGTFRWIKSENRTDTPFPAGRASKSKNVWIAEFDYIAKGIFNTQRFFDKENKPVNSMGEPLPKRPASVPELAHHVSEKLNSDGRATWVMSLTDGVKGKFIKDYTEWDMKGRIITKHMYDPETYELKETFKYENGQLVAFIIWTKDGSIQDIYHKGIDPPVLSQKILSNGQEDIHRTFFDKEGKRLYSIRNEEVSDHHFKRYYNEALVFECIQSPDLTKAPVSVRYYYRLGSWLIDYTSNGDGTGLWRLYSEDGEVMYSLPETFEEDNNEYKNWDRFMPSWLDYEETSPTDWDAITASFVEAHSEYTFNEKLEKLEIPAHLEKELKKVDWEDVETGMGNSLQLPRFIYGILSEDENVAIASLGRIWDEIEHQGTIYDSTYKVAIILARMIPFYAERVIIQARIWVFLFEVLDNPCIKDDKKLYKDLVTALQPSAPLLLQGALDPFIGGFDVQKYIEMVSSYDTKK